MKLTVNKAAQGSSLPGSESGIIKDSIRGDTLVFQDANIRFFIKLSDLYEFIKYQEDQEGSKGDTELE